MTAYFSKGGQCIVRVKSSITGARIARDPVFEGFRQSSVRMKDASPIAAKLYNQIPKEKKEFTLYRLLTGEALKMLKQGINKEVIIQKLQELYIDPALNKRIKTDRPAKEKRTSPGDMRSFIQRHLFERSKTGTRIRRRNNIMQHDGAMKVLTSEEVREDYSQQIRNSKPRPSQNNSARAASPQQRIYLGRNKQYRKFKVWLLAEGENDPGLYSVLYRHMIG